MFKLLIVFLLMTSPAFAAQWRGGTGENTLLGSSNAADIDTNTFNSIVKPLDNLLATYNNQVIGYSSASALSISAGSVTVSNSDGSIRLMLINPSPSTVDFTNIDTGAEASGTTYYVYAIAASSSATAATYKISASSTAPSGVTFYKQIGNFTNDASSNITAIVNNNQKQIGSATSKSASVVYQALTDGEFIGIVTGGTDSKVDRIVGYSDGSSSPSTEKGAANTIVSPGAISATTNANKASFSFFVKVGDYYEGILTSVGSGSAGSAVFYFVPQS